MPFRQRPQPIQPARCGNSCRPSSWAFSIRSSPGPGRTKPTLRNRVPAPLAVTAWTFAPAARMLSRRAIVPRGDWLTSAPAGSAMSDYAHVVTLQERRVRDPGMKVAMLEQAPGSLAVSGLDMHPGIPKISVGCKFQPHEISIAAAPNYHPDRNTPVKIMKAKVTPYLAIPRSFRLPVYRRGPVATWQSGYLQLRD